MKTLLLCMAAALLAGSALGATELVFIADGKRVVLEPQDRERVIAKIEGIVASANFNSRDHTNMFSGADATYWRPMDEIAAGSHIVLRYAEPREVETVGGRIPAREVWMDLRAKPRPGGGAVYPGPITLVNGPELVRLTKEAGYLVLGLGLDPAVFPHLPDIIKEHMERGRAAYEGAWK